MSRPYDPDHRIPALLDKAYRTLGFAESGITKTDFNRAPWRYLRELSKGAMEPGDGGGAIPPSEETAQ